MAVATRWKVQRVKYVQALLKSKYTTSIREPLAYLPRELNNFAVSKLLVVFLYRNINETKNKKLCYGNLLRPFCFCSVMETSNLYSPYKEKEEKNMS